MSQSDQLNPPFSILFSVGYLVLEFQTAGTGVSLGRYWGIKLLVLECQTAGTGASHCSLTLLVVV